MKKFILLAILVVSISAKAQSPVIPAYSFSFQTGLYDRGMVGLGFDFNGKDLGGAYLNLNASVGAGLYVSDDYWFFDVDPSLFLTLSPSVNFGNRNTFFTFGAEGKRIQTSFNEGYGLGGFMGLTVNMQRGFVFKLRAGATNWFDFGNDGPGFDIIYSSRTPVTPTFGMSFGYGFQMR